MKQIKQKRSTRQKKVIYDVLCSTKTHPTADWIYEEARKQIPGISLGTIYRNLQIMAEEGTIMELNYGKNQRRYDGTSCPHYHFVCEKCGKVVDFAPDCAKIGNEVLEGAPGKVSGYRFECYGICKDCLD